MKVLATWPATRSAHGHGKEIGWRPRFDLESGTRDTERRWEYRLGVPAGSQAYSGPGGAP